MLTPDSSEDDGDLQPVAFTTFQGEVSDVPFEVPPPDVEPGVTYTGTVDMMRGVVDDWLATLRGMEEAEEYRGHGGKCGGGGR